MIDSKKIKILLQLFIIAFSTISVIGTIYHYFFSGYSLMFGYALGDQWFYQQAIRRYDHSKNFYTEGFGYFPSFFLISFLVENILVYFVFLVICAVMSFYLLFKLTNNKLIAISAGIFNGFTILSGNIDPFIFSVVLICLYYRKNEVLTSFLLAFVSFKPSLILIIPYFLYVSEKRIKFLFLYGLSFMLFNFYFLLQPQFVFYWMDYAFGFFGNRFDYLRPSLVCFTMYYAFTKKKDLKISSYYFFPRTSSQVSFWRFPR